MSGSVGGTATILFSDVVGSTEQRVALGDRAADELRRRHDELCTVVVERNHGTLVKWLGDGLMATFNGAAEAVVAAVEMQSEIDRTNRRARDTARTEIRIGLSAGDVTWEDDDCHGTPVVTAARLCDIAEPGQILCDDLVRGLARGRTELAFSLVGELELKGLPEPVVGFSVPWSPAEAELAPLPAPLREMPGERPYAGRDDELDALNQLWKAAQSEGASLVLVSGEPGIGKTRLVAEVARAAHADGALVLLGRCDEQVPAPYAPWIEALRLLVAHTSEDVLAGHVERQGGEVGRIVSDLGRRVPDAPAPQAADSDTERLLLFAAVTDLVEAASRELPVLLVLDDAHWADAGSVHMLRHLVAHLEADAPVLVVVTFRDTDIDRTHALSGALADLHRQPRSVRLSLHGLDEEGIQALLERVGGHALDRDEELAFVRRLAQETEGNPFFISEILRHMVETGMLVQDGERWVGTVSASETGIPEGVRDVVGQRLSRLSDELNDLLRTAAVIGREFELSLLATVAGRAEDEVVDDLDVAVHASLLNEVSDTVGRFSFEHALVRQTLLEELSTNKRVRLHRHIAEALDARDDTPIDVLAHHYCEAALAGVAERAVEVALEAARAARHSLATDDAVRLAQRATEALDAFTEPDPGTTCDVLIELARAEHADASTEPAQRHALEAVAIAREIGDPVRLGEAGQAYQGELGMWADTGDVVAAEVLSEALDQLPEDAAAARARVAAARAHGLILAPGAAGLEAADEAIAAAQAAGDDAALRRALMVRAWCVRGTLPAPQRLEAAELAARVAREHGSRFDENSALYQLGNALVTLGLLVEAHETFTKQSDFLGSMAGWSVSNYEGALAFARGRLDDGDRWIEIAYERGLPLGETNDGVTAVKRLNSALARGDVETARSWLDQSRQTAIGLGLPSGLDIARQDGDLDAAVSELRSWLADIEPGLPNILRISAVASVSRVVFALGDLVGTEAFVSYADQFAGELVANDTWISGAVDWYRGLFAAAEGRLDDALELIRSGHDQHVRLGLDARVAESGYDLALVLRRRSGRGDEEAGRLLTETATLAEDLGMALVARNARRELSES